MSREKVDQGFFLQSRREILSGNLAIPVFADSVSLPDKIKPVFLIRSDFLSGSHGDHGAAKTGRKSIAFGRDTQSPSIIRRLRAGPMRVRLAALAHHDLETIALGPSMRPAQAPQAATSVSSRPG
jgi:hypothetical protein